MCSEVKLVVNEAFKINGEGFCFIMILCVYLNELVLHVMHEMFDLLSLLWAWLSPGTPESAVREIRGYYASVVAMIFALIYDVG